MSTPLTEGRDRTPGPGGYSIARRLLTDPDLIDVLHDCAQQYGDVQRWELAGKTAFVVADPAEVEHVLVTGRANYIKSAHYRLLAVVNGAGLGHKEGEEWSQQRRLLQPMFAKRHLGRFAVQMTDAIGEFVDGWEEERGFQVDVARAMNALTLDVVGRALFGTNLSGSASRLGAAVTVGLDTGVTAARLQLALPISRRCIDVAGALLYRAPLLPPPLNRIRNALHTIDSVVHEIIDGRLQQPEAVHNDLLDLLLSARDERGEALSRTQVRDELVTFLLAGHETTANGLAWMWYLLSQNHWARDRLHDEIDQVLHGRIPTADDVDRLPWTSACFQEAMRLYPPAWVLEREALADDRIGSHHVPAGSTIIIPTYLIQRDARSWPDPERFDPTRFLPEQARTHPRCAYLPFGAGPRICIGAGFAMLDAALITAMIAQHFTLDLVPGARVCTEPTVTLRPRGGVPMTVAHRRAR